MNIETTILYWNKYGSIMLWKLHTFLSKNMGPQKKLALLLEVASDMPPQILRVCFDLPSILQTYQSKRLRLKKILNF